MRLSSTGLVNLDHNPVSLELFVDASLPKLSAASFILS